MRNYFSIRKRKFFRNLIKILILKFHFEFDFLFSGDGKTLFFEFYIWKLSRYTNRTDIIERPLRSENLNIWVEIQEYIINRTTKGQYFVVWLVWNTIREKHSNLLFRFYSNLLFHKKLFVFVILGPNVDPKAFDIGFGCLSNTQTYSLIDRHCLSVSPLIQCNAFPVDL